MVYALGSTAIYAIQNPIDKFVLSKWEVKPHVFLLLGGVVGLGTAAIVLAWQGFPLLTEVELGWALATGALFMLSFYFYLLAVRVEEISTVVSLFYLVPVQVTILAGVFLGEVFDPSVYLGIALLVVGAILISSGTFSNFKVGRPLGLVLVATFCTAVAYVILKSILTEANPWVVFAYVRVGEAVSVLPVAYFGFKEIKATLARQGKRAIGAVAFQEALTVLALLLVTFATALAFVTFVNAIASLQPFFVLAIALALTKAKPDFLREEFSRSRLSTKLVSMLMMFVGTLLLLSLV